MADLHNLIDEAIKTQLAADSPQAFSVRKIIRNAVSHGHVRQEVKRILGETCSKPEIQKLWSRWSIIEDREELRLRMELIRHFSRIIPELHDFIKFFFRASDPVMYQAAACTLGSKLENHSELMDYFAGYMKRWSVPADKPAAVMFFEVMFLYRELIDAITPWIAQQTGGMQLGITATLGLASFGWVGVRGMSWFLFGRFGTPALLAILGRQTITQDSGGNFTEPPVQPEFWRAPVEALKKEAAWFHEEAKRMFELLSVPVMQLLDKSAT
jgi:hypothetical protein